MVFIVDLLAVSAAGASAAFLRCRDPIRATYCPDCRPKSRCWYHLYRLPLRHAPQKTAQKAAELAVENPTNDTDDTKTVITRHTDDTAGPHYSVAE